MSAPTLKLRVFLDDASWVGPGKADLLDGIRETGSISAAGRRMGMSYRRAWMLVETMNRDFGTPLVQTLTGGRGGGGAQLTETGAEVLKRYRRVQEVCAKAAAKEIEGLMRCRAKAS